MPRHLLLVPFLAAGLSAESVVTKLADPLDTAWTPSQWAPAKSVTSTTSTTVTDSTAAMKADITFSGKGFEWWGMGPATPIVIPGKTRKLSLWLKGTPGYPVILNLKDGWGREKDGNTEFKRTVDPTGEWQQATFDIPRDWVFPLSITGIGSHNWNQQKDATTISILVDQLSATTDIAEVDPASGALTGWKPNPADDTWTEPKVPLLGVSLTSPALCNVFAGEAPSFDLTLRSWRLTDTNAVLTWTITDWEGRKVGAGELPATVSSVTTAPLAIKVPGYGLFRLDASLLVDGKPVFSEQASFANLPKPIELSPEEHAKSPFGMNVHGGRHVVVEPFARAGIRWYRDYAFNLGWMNKSKGSDRSFTGWPNHRAVVDAYLSRGLGLLPIVVDSIADPPKGAAPGSVPLPDRQWKSDLFDIFNGFPAITYWEIDNEYDLGDGHAEYEQSVQWANYRAYHKAFAETLHFALDDQHVAVENGRAGIWPGLAKACIDSGDFAGIGVINIHHYCGADAPEVNIGNKNTNFGDAFDNSQKPMLFADRMRETVRISDRDGKDRQVWLTEFGWDDLAGPKVTTKRKAAYLVRGFLATLKAGVDKSFWFFDLSTNPAKANTFFDGCGLLDDRLQPVPALATCAAMTQVLPAPVWIGDLLVGEQIEGAVLTSRGKRVVVLWSRDGSPQSLSIQAEAFLDAFGNPIAKGALALGDLPIYALGVPDGEPLLRQVDYSLASLGFLQVAGGDVCPVSITITNHRTSAMSGTLATVLPAGWTAGEANTTYRVEPGATTTITIPVTVPATQKLGESTLIVAAIEGTDRIKEIPIHVLAVPPLAIAVAGLEGDPGATKLSVRIRNQSARPVDGELLLTLPKSWSTAQATIPVAALAPDETRTVEVPLTWSVDIATGERAAIAVRSAGLLPIERAIIPSHRSLAKVEMVTIDGKLDDWPTASRIDPWMLGWKGLGSDAELYAGWRTDGLAVATRVHDSTRRVTNPHHFWEGETLEVFVGTGKDLANRTWRADDHQFWFTPLFDDGRGFLGRWNRGSTNPPTRYDIPNVASKVVATEDGYILEAIIPKEAIEGWAPAIGQRLGIVMSMTVYGSSGKREVFWPRSKEDGTAGQPGLWGTWHLTE